MKRVFVSYRRIRPDEELASSLADRLNRLNYKVFIDSDIAAGQDWAAAIERALLESDYIIVLLSTNSITSDMVRHEVSIAHRHGKYILPVLVDYDFDDLPYDLGSYLHRSQGLRWAFRDGDEKLAARISEALSRASAPGVTQAPDINYDGGDNLRRVGESGAPLPQEDPRLVATIESGTLRLNSAFYISRDSDVEAAACLEAAVPTVIVKAPRQMGKSSLLARMHARARQLRRQSFYLDFQLVDREHLSDLDRLCRFLARQLQRTFRTGLDPRQVWDEYDGPKGNLNSYLEDAVLASAQAPVHLFFDEVERLFEAPYRDEFFSTIRGWHNLRATNTRFENLCTTLGHATTSTLWIGDINQSPFNVGQTIVLRGFNEKQVAELNTKYNFPLRDVADIKLLVELLNGHAYLTRLALYKLATRQHSLSDLVLSADQQDGPFAEHLLSVAITLEKAPELRNALRRILLGHGCDDEMRYQKLWAVGLIRGETRDQATVSCKLYQEYFRRHL